ncbi:hypothetical protein [Mycobacterium sp.]|uniref:hypothetical protein n=1 Tax=Mycobacterium sp. TaxID=1785 RepID=UPI003BAD19C4
MPKQRASKAEHVFQQTIARKLRPTRPSSGDGEHRAQPQADLHYCLRKKVHFVAKKVRQKCVWIELGKINSRAGKSSKKLVQIWANSARNEN